MNNIKFTHVAGGKVRIAKCKQNAPRDRLRGDEWNSPATLKARIMRQNLVLVGTRQASGGEA